MQCIGGERITAGLVGCGLQRAGTIEVDEDRTHNDGHDPPADLHLMTALDQAEQGLVYNPSGHAEKHRRFDQSRDALHLGVAKG